MEQYGLRGVAFFDMGNAFANGIDFGDMRRSVGAGARWMSPLGSASGRAWLSSKQKTRARDIACSGFPSAVNRKALPFQIFQSTQTEARE
jgi:hypothetical protein